MDDTDQHDSGRDSLSLRHKASAKVSHQDHTTAIRGSSIKYVREDETRVPFSSYEQSNKATKGFSTLPSNLNRPQQNKVYTDDMSNLGLGSPTTAIRYNSSVFNDSPTSWSNRAVPIYPNISQLISRMLYLPKF